MLVNGLVLVVIEFQFGKDLSLHSYFFQKFSVSSGHFVRFLRGVAHIAIDVRWQA